MVRTCGTTGGHYRRIAARDRRDVRDGPYEVGTHSVHVALHAPRFLALADFFSILLSDGVS